MALCTEKIEAFLQLTEEMETEDLYRKAVEWRKLYEKGISSQKSISVTEKDSFQGCGGGGGMRDGEDGVDGDQNTETKKTIKPINSKKMVKNNKNVI